MIVEPERQNAYSGQIVHRFRPHADHSFRSWPTSKSERSDAGVLVVDLAVRDPE